MITENMLVSIEFELKDNSSQEVIDSNKGQDSPLEFVTGQNEIIPKLESKIRTMNVGEAAQVVVEKSDAYGEYDEKAIQIHTKDKFGDMQLEVGIPLVGHDENGQQVHARVVGIEGEEVKVDLNHPLAGKDLLFDFKVLDVKIQTEVPEAPKAGGCGPSCGCKS